MIAKKVDRYLAAFSPALSPLSSPAGRVEPAAALFPVSVDFGFCKFAIKKIKTASTTSVMVIINTFLVDMDLF